MSVGVMSIRGSKFATSNSRSKHNRSLHHRGAQSFARLNSLDYHDEIMDAYGGSYNYDYGVPAHHESIQTIQAQQSVVGEDEYVSSLGMLISAFPDVDPSIVHDIFTAKNFDVCGTAECLSGLIPPSSTSSNPVMDASIHDSDPEDGDWSYLDETDDQVSIASSVDWVVVHDEFEVGDQSTSVCRSYSDVLLASHGANQTPFQSINVTSSQTPIVVTAPPTKRRDEAEEESLCHDYYDIKAYGQRARLASRRHTKTAKSSAK
ncbi:hypothetical protein AC1031_000993 [Aphanomyces cochlioides]|nr:hypothetical protein AC1031_000993 [Aphanomyces cochlioides]